MNSRIYLQLSTKPDTEAIRKFAEEYRYRYATEIFAAREMHETWARLKHPVGHVSHAEYAISQLYNSYLKDSKFYGGRSKTGRFVELQFSWEEQNWTSLIDYFQEKCRLECHRQGTTSKPVEWIKNRKNRFQLATSILAEGRDVTDLTVRSMFFKLTANISCAEFPPVIVPRLFDWLRSEGYTVNRVLDMSAGRGSRLMAVGACCEEYLGFDPDSCLHQNYRNQIGFAKLDPRRFRVIQAGFETAELEPEYWDVMFSSPPYFDLEIYSAESTQSVSKFASLERWAEGFVEPSVERIHRALKPGGLMMININNSFKNPDIHYTEKFFDAALAQDRFQYLGVIGFSFEAPPEKIP